MVPEDREAQLAQLTAFQMSGDLDATAKALAAFPPDADSDGSVSLGKWKLSLTTRQPDKALEALEDAPGWLLDDLGTRLPLSFLRAQALAQKGESGSARAAFLEAQKALEGLRGNPRVEADAQGCLALVYAGLGDKQAALEAGRRATNVLPVSRDVVRGGSYLAQLAMAEAQVGEKESALSHIEQLLAIPVGHVLSVASLRLDPRWDPLRDDPRFTALLEKYGADRKGAAP
jgi:serine/threonine-protein kinase